MSPKWVILSVFVHTFFAWQERFSEGESELQFGGGVKGRECFLLFSFLFFLGGMGSSRETTTEKTWEMHFFKRHKTSWKFEKKQPHKTTRGPW